MPYRDKNSTAVRDILFSVAKGEWVLCMDSHVMLPGGVLQQLVDYMTKNPDSKDLLQGPILDDSGQVYASHFKAEWRAGMYGIWGLDDRAISADSDPFEIEMQGLGLFACRKQAWPGFNNLFIGFGGEEGYIHQKIRNQGGKCLCLPFLRWSHRFARPHGASYPNKWEDRIKNYLIGFEEAGLDTQQIQDHFDSFLPARAFNTAKHEVEQIKASPFQQFDHAVCINLDSKKLKWEQMQKRFDQIHIKDRVKRFSAISTPEFHHTGCALSHRKIIEQAKLYGYESVLVFEDDSLMLSGADVFLSHALKELQDRQWKILYLGGANHRFEFELVEGCSNLKEVPKFRLTCTHALIYHHSVYDELLDELPSNEYEMEQWLVDNYAIDQYLCKIDSRYLVEPKLFTQPNLRNNENIAYRQFYK